MISNLPEIVQKYLSKYGNSKWLLEYNKGETYDCVVVVPAIAEYENIIILLNSLSENIFGNDYKIIIVFVINDLASSSTEVKTDNKKSLFLLNAILKNNSSLHPVVNKYNSSGLSIGFVDASSAGFEMPAKTGGVGLARKIGMDLSLSVFNYKSENILICLDADCTIEKNYFEKIISLFNKQNLNAAVINYEHPLTGNDENVKAIICYEIFLRYYELGLKYSGSDYAFQTVGSAMACDYEAYIKIEGMNKLKAAEDFYFLEKLSKHYKIHKINYTTVFPSGRKSWRVPFGTGQRINRFFTGTTNEYLLYDPMSFSILKEWLQIFHLEKKFTGENYLQMASDIHQELYNFLGEQNFRDDYNRILANSKNVRQINLQKHRWFDGFKTLKLIHHLRDKAFPLINMFDALDLLLKELNLPAVNERDSIIPDISVQKKYLHILRSCLKNDN
jgi:hypothetical protein